MSDQPAIKFGTSGWRAILAEEFTFENAGLVVRAIADELTAQGKTKGGVVITHDTRFLGERFALHAARVLAGAGLKPLLTDRDTPTPVVAFETIRRKADGCINFTASHNPAPYQGLKFSPENGGPASKELTVALEKRIAALQAKGERVPLGPAPADRIDPSGEYKKRIAAMIDLAAIKKSGLKILVNCLHGTGRGYLDALLREAGCDVVAMNDKPDPTFGGHAPEPAPEHVPDFIARLESGPYDIGLATDGDADRFGVFERGGFAPNANEILGLVLDHLVTSRGWKGIVVRSVATSHFVDAVAKMHGCRVVEVPVGFKWIAGEMEKAPAEFMLGGEESGGLTIRGHVPEKDGVLACLLVAEMVAQRGKTLAALLKELRAKSADIASRRINVHYDEAKRDALLTKAAAPAPAAFAGVKVADTNRMDGTKYLLADGSWIMLRFSGTEPVIRLYVEGAPDRIAALEKAGREFLAAD